MRKSRLVNQNSDEEESSLSAGPLWVVVVTGLFNNMRTLKFEAQPTNAFFATVNQMFGGSSQLPTMLSELYSTI